MCDASAFFRKWLIDLRDCQREDGRVENVSPSVHRFAHREPMGGAAGWADAAVIIPYTLWKTYHDDSFIRDNYPLMLDWKKYIEKAASNKLLKKLSFLPPANKMYKPYYVEKGPLEKYVIESGSHWGEWLEPDVDSVKEMSQPKPEITTAYASYSMRLLAEMAREIGEEEIAKECETFSVGAKEAYNHYFVENGHIKTDRQAPLVRALALAMLREDDAKSVAQDLNESAMKRDYTVGTGFLSTPFVLDVLTQFGYVETAYKMLENVKAPGWLAMVDGGATTVWETYLMFDKDGHPLSHSMNHYSPGAVCAYLFHTICGIRITKENEFTIRPIIGGSLTNAQASYISPFGEAKVEWEKDEIFYTITIPANCSANIIIGDEIQQTVCAGEYHFNIKK